MLKREKYTEQYSQILEAATELFSTCGYDGVSTTQIAAAAGVSQPSIHYHFGSKTELWIAAIRSLADKIGSDLPTDWETIEEMDPIEALQHLCGLIIDVSIQRPELGRFILLEGQAGGERLEWLYDMVMKTSYTGFCRLIQRGIDSGQIKKHQPHHILMLLHGAIVTYFNVAPLMEIAFGEDPGEKKPAAEFRAAFLDIVVEGLRVNPIPASKKRVRTRNATRQV
ncbi:TetR/AcrR family transcriptional regulator [Hyphomonas sp.]|uniref:TetR/AcrR family transcriptional regulator n=1 Tax=Hyphomonas sp. TaxID=87 RepID=UPI00352957B5